jgi:acyl-CoA reductase-like NAD-dependent aldehyde dehydrogenase
LVSKPTRSVKWTGPLVTIECQNPATLEKLGEVPSLSAGRSGRATVERARQPQVSWGQTSLAERRRVLRMLLDYIIDFTKAEICRLCSTDSGKTMADAAMGEIFPGLREDSVSHRPRRRRTCVRTRVRRAC